MEYSVVCFTDVAMLVPLLLCFSLSVGWPPPACKLHRTRHSHTHTTFTHSRVGLGLARAWSLFQNSQSAGPGLFVRIFASTEKHTAADSQKRTDERNEPNGRASIHDMKNSSRYISQPSVAFQLLILQLASSDSVQLAPSRSLHAHCTALGSIWNSEEFYGNANAANRQAVLLSSKNTFQTFNLHAQYANGLCWRR